MKRSMVLMAALLSLGLKAQIQIGSAHMPSIGDTVRFSNSNTLNADFTQTGANMQWDFRGLNITGQDLYKFQALLSTPYAGLSFTGMPFGSIGYKIADSIGMGQTSLKNIYNFYEKKSSGWSAVGTGFTLSALPVPAGGVYSDKDEIYTFPLRYQDRDSGTFDVSTPLGNQFLKLGTFRQQGYRINLAEGWGSISTPYASAVSCLKVKSVVYETDSLKLTTPSLNLGFQSVRVEYRWLSTTEKIPLLEVSGTEIAGVFTPSLIRYRDRFRLPPPSPFAPVVRFSADRFSGQAGLDTFTLINLSTPGFGNTYNWRISPATGVRFVKSSDPGSTNPSLVFDSSGLYDVTLSAVNIAGASDSTAADMISVSSRPSSLKRIPEIYPVSVYPNPARNHMYLNRSGLSGSVCRIFDSSGKLLAESPLGADQCIDCSNLPAGLYTLVILGPETLLYTQFNKE